MTRSNNIPPNIGLVGCGFVGQSLLKLFGKCEVYDPAQGRTDKAAINRCRFAFVCVPTPTGPDGECDVSIVEETVRWIESEFIVIRSTVAPGTTDRLRRETGKRIIFQPEYIGETVAHPLLDHQAQGFSVLGGPIEDTSAVADLYKGHYHAAHRFYFYHGPDGRTREVHGERLLRDEGHVLQRVLRHRPDVRRGLQRTEGSLAGRPTRSAETTPSSTPTTSGFGGKCLPKDTTAIIAASEERGLTPPLLRAVMAANAKYRVGDVAYRPYLSFMGPSCASCVRDRHGNQTGGC